MTKITDSTTALTREIQHLVAQVARLSKAADPRHYPTIDGLDRRIAKLQAIRRSLNSEEN